MSIHANEMRVILPEPGGVPPIGQISNTLHNAISDLDQAITNLLEKIQPIVTPNDDPLRGADPCTTEEVSPRSALYGWFDNEIGRVNEMIRTVRHTTERVEV